VTSLSSRAGDGATEETLAVARYQCQVILVMSLSRQLGRGVISRLSHAGDDTVESC
jgi:hypothetical protein